MKKLFIAIASLVMMLFSCTSAVENDVATLENSQNEVSSIQETEESSIQETEGTSIQEDEETSRKSDGKWRLYKENVPYMETRFPNSIMEGDIEIYYSDRVPEAMLDDTIRLINSTDDTKVISQIFLDTEYDPNIDSSDRAYAFDRNIMFIVDYQTDGPCSMFERYFFHELGHLLLDEYAFLNDVAVEDIFPDWVYYFSTDINEDFASVYEYYMVIPDVLDVYIKYDGITPSVEAMKELIASFDNYE